MITGKNSGDWRQLEPGESNTDGTRSYGTENVYTAIVYVNIARLADGTVWHAENRDLLERLRDLGTGIRDFGSVEPDPEPAGK